MLQSSVLLAGLDVSLIITKCIVKMFKMFLTKDVAKLFTAVRHMKGKKIMKSTNFYECVESNIFCIALIIIENVRICVISQSDFRHYKRASEVI